MRRHITNLPKQLAVLAITVGLASITSAAHAQQSPWYFGAGIGQSSVDYQGGVTAKTLGSKGFTPVSASEDDSDIAGKLFVGYSFNDFIAVEGAYFDAGKFDFSYGLPLAQTLAGKGDVAGWNVDLVGTIPLNESFAFLARAGINYVDFEESLRAGPANALFNIGGNEDAKTSYGFGLQYNMNDRLGLRAEWERHNLDDHTVIFDNDVEMLTLSAIYRFGRKAMPVAATPAAAPAPAAAPRPAAPPAPAAAPAPVTVRLSADALFAFDKSELAAAGRAELDQFIRDLGNVQYETIIVIGHTDRLGADSYNQELSERRATIVRDYLVAGKVNARSIRSEGRGESMPVTTAAQCQDRTGQALRDCYQPDRRVEVEVTGVRPAQ